MEGRLLAQNCDSVSYMKTWPVVPSSNYTSMNNDWRLRASVHVASFSVRNALAWRNHWDEALLHSGGGGNCCVSPLLCLLFV